MLQRLDPPIVTTIRTVERDCSAIREDARRYLTATNFDSRFEVGAALARHELIARKATQRALEGNGDDAKWARIAIRATEAKTKLLQDINLIDRTIGTLFIDDGQRVDRIPSGTELQQLYDSITVSEDENVSPAERAYQYGDAAQAERQRARRGQRSAIRVQTRRRRTGVMMAFQILRAPLRALETHTCEACGFAFRLSADERREIVARGLPVPERCGYCQRLAQRAAQDRVR